MDTDNQPAATRELTPAVDRFAEFRKVVEGKASRITVPIELRAEPEDASDPDRITISGHASVFDRMSDDLGGFRERIHRGAFRRVLDEDQDVRLLVNHEPYPVLARTKAKTLELREDPRGLRVYADVGPTSFARDLRVSMQRGDIDQMSYGFVVAPDGDRWSDEGGQIVRDVYAFDRLIDVSVVTFPAYPQTDVAARSADPQSSVVDTPDEETAPLVGELADAGATIVDDSDGAPTGDESQVRTRRSLADRILQAHTNTRPA